MPYIKSEKRLEMDRVIEAMYMKNVQANGDLNYILFTYCKRHVTRSYNSLKNFCGELRQCATEIERKILGPYEEEKIKENGDIE